MNYKELFEKVSILISSPAKAWEEISLEDNKRLVLEKFVYPMIGLCALSVFIGSLILGDWDRDALQSAMRSCCFEAVALFGGYFIAAYVIDVLQVKVQKCESDIALAQQFAGYAMAVIFVIRILQGVFPDLTLLGMLFQFYIIYVVWEGISLVMHVDDNHRLKLTVSYSLLMLLCPLIVQTVFNKMIAILN